jgi:Cys-rich repeat protein
LAAVAAGLAGLVSAEAACPPSTVRGSGGRCLCRTTGRPPIGGTCTGCRSVADCPGCVGGCLPGLRGDGFCAGFNLTSCPGQVEPCTTDEDCRQIFSETDDIWCGPDGICTGCRSDADCPAGGRCYLYDLCEVGGQCFEVCAA